MSLLPNQRINPNVLRACKALPSSAPRLTAAHLPLLFSSPAEASSLAGLQLYVTPSAGPPSRAAVTRYTAWVASTAGMCCLKFWRPEVWNQDASRAGSFQDCEGESCKSPSLACRWPSLCSRGFLPMCVSVSTFPFLISRAVILD